ncbi:MAG: alpha/beta fold hydrolase [Candidatus Acidiferrales bacterium]
MGHQARNAAERQDLGSTPGTAQTLARIWRNVLGVSPHKPEQNFFEAGGDPPLAIQFCDQIHAAFGYTLQPLALYSAPTLFTLARVLTEGIPVPFSNALLLKAGSLAPPVFLFHGIGGNVMEFFDLVEHLDGARPIYGLQAKGSDGLDDPLDTVEHMAEYHLQPIRRLQPSGPYLLCGYSFGGLIALEIARRLRESGETVGMLAMIDAYPHQSRLRAAQRYESYLQRLRDRLRRALGNATSTSTAQQSQELSERICGSAIRPVTEAARLALRRYIPTPYSGKVEFVTAQIKTVFPENPVATWRPFVREFSIETVPGTHHGMLQTSAATLASGLARHVTEAIENRPAPPANSPDCPIR